ncbi:hypothetical protein L1277_000735 [Okibacterium sp. HSC-33S16]|uniref:hypothetical protein n=1 Tax=Okibacterium sp. HSC-33S16 TaxID=2910965 RepID=UPI00209CF42E|nr:hypothetical protein [Okibacterium sp. HSC-33S16]MCP2030671.1 hypothetical protein [Okibacterium sp. HSC-33S16]
MTVVGGMLLTGCSALGVLGKQSTASFDDVHALSQSSAVHPEWVPDDATKITLLTSTMEDAEDAVLLLQSGSALASDECIEVPRRSAPSWIPDGAPNVYELESVFACGDWTVAPTADDAGWFGWTPNAPGERADAAQAHS